MKDELNSKLVEILSSIQSAAGKASDFAVGQLPDIAQSYIMYGRAISIFWVVAGLLIIGLAIILWQSVPRLSESEKLDSFFLFFGGHKWVAVFIATMGFITFCNAISATMLVWFAPKVWLLKEIASLLK